MGGRHHCKLFWVFLVGTFLWTKIVGSVGNKICKLLHVKRLNLIHMFLDSMRGLGVVKSEGVDVTFDSLSLLINY